MTTLPLILASLKELASLDADTIIDVRAPAEFAEDHIPGAINLPVLNDEERARVGTIYVQDDPFRARKVGAALVASNSARHLQNELAQKPGGWRPLVYCWRGGQRSGSFSTILSQVGWRVHLLTGGYKSYRKLVVAAVYDAQLAHRFILIDGGTGTAKTRLLDHLRMNGEQVIDLEGFAHHRGSIFGGFDQAQPSQKMFESRIASALANSDPDRPTYVEAESNKVGNLRVPPSLWKAMRGAPRIVIRAPLAARAEYLVRAYSDLSSNATRFRDQLDRLRSFHSAEQIDNWHQLVENGDWVALAKDLIQAHYDPRYGKSAVRDAPLLRTFDLPDLDDKTLANTARNITESVSAPTDP